MRYLRFKLPKDMKNFKPKRIIDLSSIGEAYIEFVPRRRKRK